MRYDILLQYVALLLFIGTFVACTPEEAEREVKFQEVEMEASLLFSTERSTEFTIPSLILATDEGFVLFDEGHNRFVLKDFDWNKVTEFGNEGRGPGDFQQVNGFWEVNNSFWVYDRLGTKFILYSREGKWMKDQIIDSDLFPVFPFTMEVLEPHLFTVATNGENGSLATLVDTESKQKKSVGEAIGDYVRFDAPSDPDHTRQAVSAGSIPDYYKNSVILNSNQSGLFVFQQTTAVLEKYSHSGEHIWSRNLEFPVQQGLFDHMFEVNADRLNRGLHIGYNYGFNYAISTYATEEGIAVLLNVFEDDPVTIAWITNSGEEISMVSFHGIEHQPGKFAISSVPDQPIILFVDSIEGKIYKANWPF